MGMILVLHIVAGLVGIGSGFIALYSSKGAKLHRRAGIVFVCAMVTLCPAGLLIAVVRNVTLALNVPTALVTACLVITGLTTVRPPSELTRWIDRGAMVVLLSVGVAYLATGLVVLATGAKIKGVPTFVFFLWGVSGTIAGVGDVRVMRSGALKGTARLARHLWRMSFPLSIAALSLPRVIPKPLRITPVLALPVLAVAFTMFYWLWRLRIKRSLRGIVASTLPSPATGGSL